MRQKWVATLCFCLISIHSLLLGNIEEIQIKWTATLCGSDCIKNLQREFSRIPGFQSASFTPTGVTIKWKPGAPFSFQWINTAMRMVGIRLQDIRVKASGTVYEQRGTFFLSSAGDGTTFMLLGPTRPEPTGYTVVNNIETHGLSGALQEKLSKAIMEQSTVVVDGPLFQPFQMPNMRLIVDSLRITNPPQEDPNTRQQQSGRPNSNPRTNPRNNPQLQQQQSSEGQEYGN